MNHVLSRAGAWILPVILSFAAAGCGTKIMLLNPASGDVVRPGKAPGPPFAWRLDKPSERRILYTLKVSDSGSFDSDPSLVYIARQLTTTGHSIPDGQGWLPGTPGGARYHWTVQADILNEDGEIVETVQPEKPRHFLVEKRETVEIEMRLPKGASPADAKITLLAPRQRQAAPLPIERGACTFQLEHGETRAIVIQANKEDGQPVAVGGEITVLAVNDATRHGRILIDNLSLDTLVKATEEGVVGTLTYTLGDEKVKIVKLTYGSRVK